MSLKLLVPVCLFSGLSLWCLMAEDAPIPDRRAAARKQFDAGNFRDAYDVYSKLALHADNAGDALADDLWMAVQCLQRLQRQHETDAFREKVIATHAGDWRLLAKAAWTLVNGEHWGFIVAGEFQRGNQRGGGQYADATERDRTRALQLMDQAQKLVENEPDKNAAAQFYQQFAQHLLFNREYGNAWRLQDLTDLTQLPDYEEGHFRRWGWRGDSGKGAPVDAQGNPVYYTIPESFAAAANDGQRWRWCLEQTAAHDPSLRASVDWTFANFLHSQFGVHTMQQFGIHLPRAGEDDDVDESGPYALQSLGEDETICKLATGVKRFTLPDEFNPIVIFKRLAAGDDRGLAEQSYSQLAQIFEDRQQYPKAAGYWREAIQKFGPGHENFREARLKQIVGNWGRFEAVFTQAAGKGATVEYRFRNGKRVHFDAHRIDIAKLLEDVKAYLKSNPRQLDWNQLQVDNIGYRLVQENESKYVVERVAQWDLDLEPRPEHLDRRVTVTTPLQKAGAYLLVGRMDDGNLSRIVLWLDDTVIAKKQLNGKAYYFVADAVSGKPLERVNVEFFGWKQEQLPNTKREFRVVTGNFAEFTDKDGQVLPDTKLLSQEMQWVAIARGPGGRLAHLGFSGVWYGQYHDAQYDETKVMVITDRPVYRPSQKVEFKFWIGQAKYDNPDPRRFASQKFTVQINDPQGVEVFKQDYTTDEYGGFSGEYSLPDEPPLGQYSVHIVNHPQVGGGGSFRVEEYKKPEFEVTVTAPEKPVMLGEKITAKIEAKYYFGAPVTEATVAYKVHRQAKEARWFPYRPWDWLYGSGYWWFAADYDWFPGFARWGCRAPIPFWWGWSPEQPELVIDQEVPIGADGTVEVEIDTTLAKELHGDDDHEYRITAEVVDASRRTIVGGGSVLVAREPFKVFAWTDRGYYRVGDTIHARFQARTLDGKGVKGDGTLKLLKVSYGDDGEPVENAVQQWDLDTDDEGRAEQEIKATEAGQYRLSYAVTDADGHTIEGGYVFVIMGEGFDGSEFRFNDLEVVTDKPEYAPGDKVKLLINTNRVGSTVLLFVRPTNGVYLAPTVLRLAGKSTVHEVTVATKDMPNFFVEGVTVAGGKLHAVMREVVVPPEKRVLNVDVEPSSEKYKPGQEATVKVKLTEANGEPFAGSVVMSIYDRAVEYISGGSNVPDIKEHFWKWRRHHHPHTEHSLARWFGNLLKSGEIPMNDLGAFGGMVAELEEAKGLRTNRGRVEQQRAQTRSALDASPAAPMAAGAAAAVGGLAMDRADKAAEGFGGGPGGGAEMVQPTVRTQFADTALWKADITTGADGTADVTLKMPENLTGWKVRAWAMGKGTRVGEGTEEVVTFKNLLLRLQAPRFFVEKDEVVLSAIVHNYLETEKQCQVELALEGGTLAAMAEGGGVRSQESGVRGKNGDQPLAPNPEPVFVTIPAGGEARIDWRVKAVREGLAKITMKALTDEESDAMEMEFPVYVHGILKTESFSGVIRPKEDAGVITLNVPEERRPEQTRLEIRYSPTLAGAMVDALPYLVDYPYGCTEQTLNRFLPTVITQNILKRMNLDLAAIKEKRTNLNAQEIGDDPQRAADWKRLTAGWHQAHGGLQNPVFDEAEVAVMVKQGVRDLTAMQLTDGGWGWFSGWGEHSWPHTTAVVVHGLQIAQQNGVALVPGTMERGIEWLKKRQAEQVALLQLWERDKNKGKSAADNTDALVYMVLVDADVADAEMQRFLYRDRTQLSLYGAAMFGLALHKQGDAEKRDTIIRNIDQFVVVDDENQTAYIDLPNRANYWWYWYGDTIEANAYYLKLLTKTNPQDPRAAGLVKYLLNNRRHATYWNSTRDTAVVIEAMAEYLVASGEDQPNLLVEVWIDGEMQQAVEITPETLFAFDNSFVIEGAALTAGEHKIELRKKALKSQEPRAKSQEDKGQGTKDKGQAAGASDPDAASVRATSSPLYYNAYLTNFTLEDFIPKAGLEIKVQRAYYRLVQREGATDVAQGSKGQVIDQKVEKYDRFELAHLGDVTSGDLIEVELEIDSKNDYEYVVFEDLKAAGFEPVDVRSGYTKGGLGAYVEFRDEKVAFFLRQLARGKHSVSYRLRAETPGTFSALPTKAFAMYAPELKANSDEIRLIVMDRPEHDVAARLQLPVDADFRRTPLHQAFASIGEQVGVKFEIDGDALKDAGLTRNMPQTLSLVQAPATDALQAILKQYSDLGGGNRLVISVDERKGVATVLTTKSAREQGRPILALAPAHRITADTAYYQTGPQQMTPPDGTFRAGTKVALIRTAGSYSLVTSAAGVEAWVASEAVAVE